MLHLLRRHPLPIRAHLTAALTLTYALPAAALEPLLAPGLELDRYRDFGFLAIGLVETGDLRPTFLPAGLGMDFLLAGYRIFVRYRTAAGRTLRGLKILRSDTDRALMQVFGNALTHYRYARSRWSVHRDERKFEISVQTADHAADLDVAADLAHIDAPLPADSPFPDWREARKFAGPLPFTFGYEPQTHSMIRVEGVRQRWNPRPVAVTVRRNAFLEPFRQAGPLLASAFYLHDVPYRWKPGVREVLS
jgi:hypothetical protein